MNTPNLDELLDEVRRLPSLPAAVTELILTLHDEDAVIDDLANGISSDQGLAARVLQVANSPFYGLHNGIASIHEAIVILGFRAVSNLVMAAALTGYFRPPPESHFDLERFWSHGLYSALGARTLARQVSLDPEAGFTVGLLHDIGQLMLVSVRPSWHTLVFNRQQIDQCDWLSAERKALGFDHTQSGAALAERWHFPAEILAAVANHHAPSDTGKVTLADVVHLSDRFADQISGTSPGEALPTLESKLVLDDAQQSQLLAEMEKGYAAYKNLLST